MYFRSTLSLIISCLCTVAVHAQNVGIGTATPLTRLQVSSSTDTNLLVLENTNTLNTGTNLGLLFRNGLYYTGIIRTVGTGTVYSRLGFYTFASADPNGLIERMSITDDGNIGIGTSTPAAKLDINGQLRIQGGAPAAGRVLTSDVNGLASWQPVAGQGTGFRGGIGGGGFNVSSGTITDLIFTVEDYDDASSFFTGNFVAPSAGLYHFDVAITWNITSVAIASQYYIFMRTDGVERNTSALQLPANPGSGPRTQVLSADLKLLAGQTVTVAAFQNSGILQPILGAVSNNYYSYFSGRRVY